MELLEERRILISNKKSYKTALKQISDLSKQIRESMRKDRTAKINKKLEEIQKRKYRSGG